MNTTTAASSEPDLEITDDRDHHEPIDARTPRVSSEVVRTRGRRRRRKLGRRVALAALAAALPLGLAACEGVPIGGPIGAPQDPPSSGRFVEPVFASSSVTTMSYADVLDANSDTISLAMDVYEPDGDDLTTRPVVVLVHGGGWTTGSRSDQAVVDQAMDLSAKGYVAVSIDYRSHPDVTAPYDLSEPATATAAANATSDLETAIAFLQMNHESLRINTGAIFVVGRDAGAVAAIGLAQDAAFDPASNGVLGVISIAGTGTVGSPAGVPVRMIHGDADVSIPVGSAQDLCASLSDCDLQIYNGADHDLDASAHDFVVGMTQLWMLALA